MKATLTTLFISIIAFGCTNTDTPYIKATKTDSIKPPAINKTQNDSTIVIHGDTIDENDITINDIPIITAPIKNVDKLLQSADSVKHGRVAAIGYTYTEYYIKKTDIRYHKNKLADISIEDNSVTFAVKGQRIKIGAGRDILKAIFPDAFAEHLVPTHWETDYILTICLKHQKNTLFFDINRAGILCYIGILIRD